jgi:hypothetical protein
VGVAGIQKYFAYCVATDSSGLYKKILESGAFGPDRRQPDAVLTGSARML